MSKRTAVLAASALGAIVIGFGGNAGAEPVGFLAVAEGDVEVQATGTNSWTAANIDQDVEIGDTIRTGLDSRAKILLIDDTTLSLDEDTELRVDSLHVGAAALTDRSIMRQIKGRVRTVVGEAFGGPTRVEVHTPTAVVGVKGTDLESTVEERDKRTLVCLVDGKIFVRILTGEEFEPKPGYCVYAYEDDFGEEFLNPQVPLRLATSSIGSPDSTVDPNDFGEPPGGPASGPEGPEGPDPFTPDGDGDIGSEIREEVVEDEITNAMDGMDGMEDMDPTEGNVEPPGTELPVAF